MSNRLDQDREKRLQPKRMEYAKKQIEKLGYEVREVGSVELNFLYKGEGIAFFPYSGWHTGKTIKDGRGLKNLMNQIKVRNEN